ncbi:MAG: chromate efflux transporter [Saprospiraceae bacterium]
MKWLEYYPAISYFTNVYITMEKAAPQHPSFREALLFWLKLGLISFGGPAGQIAIMHEYLVEKKKWISESKFLHALNYCMILPGPEAQQLATYNGWLLHGVKGGLAAGILFILPSVFILLGLSFVYVTFGETPVLNSILDFLKPAVVAIVILALLKIAKKSLVTPIHYILASLAFCCIYFLNVPFPLIVFGAIGIGAISIHFIPKVFEVNIKKEEFQKNNETFYVVNQNSILAGSGFSIKRLAFQIIGGLFLWCAPLVIIYWTAIVDFNFWKQLSLFFTKATFVTFGGAYAVLPYVAQVSVETYGWLTKLQMIDGLALGETTPGPLIMVLAFVGFMAGYNSFTGNIGMATLGLGLTTYYTFLPSFLFIFVGAPLIERTQSNTYLKTLFGFATAAVTGVILNLGIYFGKAVIIPSPPTVLWIPLAWTIISFIALRYLKINMIVWIGLSMIIGLLDFLVYH